MDNKVSFSTVEGEPSSSEYQESSVSDDHSPEDAKQEMTDAIHYCLHLLQSGNYIMVHWSNSISSL